MQRGRIRAFHKLLLILVPSAKLSVEFSVRQFNNHLINITIKGNNNY